MAIALFAVIGWWIYAPTAYWVLFSIYCTLRVFGVIFDTLKEIKRKYK